MDPQHIAGILALGVLLPAWLVFGFLDWRHHRKSDIAGTSGWRESGLHLLLVGQAGIAVLTALFFEPNGLILAVAIAAYVAHEVTTSIDVGFAVPRRVVTAHEQRVHDFLTAIPLALLAILIVTSGDTSDFALRWREEPLPTWYLAVWLLVSPINAVLYLEEFWRCRQAQARMRSPTSAV